MGLLLILQSNMSMGARWNNAVSWCEGKGKTRGCGCHRPHQNGEKKNEQLSNAEGAAKRPVPHL